MFDLKKSFAFEMLKCLLLVLLWRHFASSDTLSRVTVRPSFQRIGSLATGLSYGHVHGQFNFHSLRRAHQDVVRIVEEKLRTTSPSSDERLFIEALRPQMKIAEKTIDDLQLLFFGGQKRQKRQLFLGIAMALGLVSVGTSIYTTTEVMKLHNEISDVRSDVRHLVHFLEEEAHSINQVMGNMKTLSTTCKLVLEKLDMHEKQIVTLTNVMGLMAMINTLNAELLAWGKGLEALHEGKLHPALVDHQKLRKAMETILEKARATGRKPLHEDEKMLLKAPVSFMAMADGRIIFIVHVPLIESVPMELFEFISAPVQVRNLYLEVAANKRVFAVDERGQAGLEMSEEELIRCQTQDKHDGKVFICPNGNLVRNNVRKTCLGAIFFNNQEEVVQQCDFTLMKKIKEDVKQIGKNEILIFTAKNQTIIEKCKNGTSYQQILSGLTRKTTKGGCEVTTRDFTFKSLVDIEMNENFICREVQTSKFGFLESLHDEKIDEALEGLKGLKDPKKINVEEMKRWISQKKDQWWAQSATWSLSAMTGSIGIVSVLAILFLYCRYKKRSDKN